jgi:hypothetical protein
MLYAPQEDRRIWTMVSANREYPYGEVEVDEGRGELRIRDSRFTFFSNCRHRFVYRAGWAGGENDNEPEPGCLVWCILYTDMYLFVIIIRLIYERTESWELQLHTIIY